MIRFVDLTKPYHNGTGPPVCAFLDTTTERFLGNGDSDHTFHCLEDIEEHPCDRLLCLIPEGFFKEKVMKQYRFHWSYGETEEGWGKDVADAFTRLGYGAGAIRALDYYEVIK